MFFVHNLFWKLYLEVFYFGSNSYIRLEFVRYVTCCTKELFKKCLRVYLKVCFKIFRKFIIVLKCYNFEKMMKKILY